MGAFEAVYLSDPECARHARALVHAARHRAKTKSLPCDLDVWSALAVQAVLERGRCQLTGLAFGKGPFAPTLDRIEPAKGYVPHNVRVVCRLVNAALGDWGEATLRQAMSTWFATPPLDPANLQSVPFEARMRALFD